MWITIVIKKATRDYVSSEKQVHVASKWHYTAVGWEVQVPWGSDRMWNNQIDTWIGEANAVLCHSAVKTGSFQTVQRCQFLYWSLFRASAMVMNLK